MAGDKKTTSKSEGGNWEEFGKLWEEIWEEIKKHRDLLKRLCAQHYLSIGKHGGCSWLDVSS